MKKRLLVGVAVAALGLTVVLIVRGGVVDVTVAVVARDTLSVTIPAEGQTRARERFTVVAPISGRLTRMEVREGDIVARGQPLALLYPAPEDPRVIATARAEVSAAEARCLEAEARVSEARSQAIQAEREVERRRPLVDMGAITRERMEQAEPAATVASQRLESAEASLATSRATLEAARARLLGAESTEDGVRPIEVTAPVDGRVLDVPDQSARIVPAGAPLLELADLDGIEIVLDVLSEDAVRVKPGDVVVINGWGGDGRLEGAVRRVTLVGYTKVSALGVEEQRVDVVADLHRTPPSLGTGYRVSGEIVVWRGEDVLSVPTSALFRVGEGWQAFVAEDGRARRRDVVVGQRNERTAEVLGGLTERETVILFPPEGVRDGASVTIVGR